MSITVGELITKLRDLPEDLEVRVSSDPEGNSFATVDSEISMGYWDEETSEWYEAGSDEDDDDGPAELPNAITLWPEY